jgi:SMODS-associating 2TM, beta-strand rich effector domain
LASRIQRTNVLRIRPDNFKRFTYFITVLALLSYAIVLASNLLISMFWGSLPPWVETPSVIGTLVLLYSAFDSYLWHWPIFRWLGIIDFPDLRGRWSGMITSSWRAGQSRAVLEIVQTSSFIMVALYAMDSHSESRTADFEIRRDGQPMLHYIYENIPTPTATGTMKPMKVLRL